MDQGGRYEAFHSSAALLNHSSFSQTVTNLLFNAVASVTMHFVATVTVFSSETDKDCLCFTVQGVSPEEYMDTQVWEINHELKTHSTVEQSLRAMALAVHRMLDIL